MDGPKHPNLWDSWENLFVLGRFAATEALKQIPPNIQADRQLKRWKMDANQTIWGWRITFGKMECWLRSREFSQDEINSWAPTPTQEKNLRATAVYAEVIASYLYIYIYFILPISLGPFVPDKWTHHPKSLFVSSSIFVSSFPGLELNGFRTDSLEFFKGANIVHSSVLWLWLALLTRYARWKKNNTITL